MLGVGLGASQGKMYGIYENKLQDIGFDSYGTFLLSAQVGGITMFNRYFGLEYYYNLDVVFDDSLKNKEVSTKISNGNIAIVNKTHFDIFGILATSTLNANAIMNVFSSEKLIVGFSAGLGLGVDISRYKGSFSSVLSDSFMVVHIPDQKIDYLGVSFDMRANLGMRFVFDEKYGLNFNFAIPFFANVIDPSTALKDNMTFSARFTYYLF